GSDMMASWAMRERRLRAAGAVAVISTLLLGCGTDAESPARLRPAASRPGDGPTARRAAALLSDQTGNVRRAGLGLTPPLVPGSSGGGGLAAMDTNGIPSNVHVTVDRLLSDNTLVSVASFSPAQMTIVTSGVSPSFPNVQAPF